jgi:sec-independent protein translocase protein TatC
MVLEGEGPLEEEKRGDLVTHLSELRARLVRAIIYASLGTVVVWIFYGPLYQFLTHPITAGMKAVGGQLTVRGLLEGFLVKCEIALVGGVILASPFIIWEVWAFVAPGLTRTERSAIAPLIPTSIVLFLMGVALGYLITGPSVTWLMLYVPPDARALLTLNDTLLLVLKFYLAFGLSFQLPIVLVVLAKIGIVNSRLLSNRWREATVAIFLIAGIITPTWDPITMTVCAMPMVILYLGTIGVIKLIERGQQRAARKEQSPAG